MASLIVTESPAGQVGKQFVLQKRPLSGGRHPSQEIQLVDEGVSRKHFLIRFENDHHIILETQSKNGIFVNDAQIKQHELHDGDKIRVGMTELVYHAEMLDDQTDALQQPRRGERHLREGGTVINKPLPGNQP